MEQVLVSDLDSAVLALALVLVVVPVPVAQEASEADSWDTRDNFYNLKVALVKFIHFFGSASH